MIKSFAKSHIGQRKLNEDSFCVCEDLGLYIVADGVGGLSKGEVASQLACKVVERHVKAGDSLKESILRAHKAIVNKIGENKENQGMATTIVVVRFDGNFYDIAWVGDSRVYLWDGQLKLLTRDHSYVEMLLYNGHIKVDEIDTHPDKNVISQALGISRKDISVSFNTGTLEKDHILLICSDGLYGAIDEFRMIKQIKNNKSVNELTESLVEQAVANQGKDNITLITVKSENDSYSEEEIIKADVIRSFNSLDGKVVDNDVKSKTITKRVEPKELKNHEANPIKNSDNSIKKIIIYISILVVLMMLVINLKI